MFEVSEINGITLIQIPQKRATAEIAREFKDFLFSLIDKNNSGKIIIDLNEVQFMDSFFLGAVVSGLKKIRSQNGDLRLLNVQDPLIPVLELMHLDEVFKIFTSRQDALNSFQSV